MTAEKEGHCSSEQDLEALEVAGRHEEESENSDQLRESRRVDNSDDLRVAAAVYEACIDRKKADTAPNDVKELFKSWTIREWPRDSNGAAKDAWNFAAELVRDLGLSTILEVGLAAGHQFSNSVIIELRKPTRLFSCSGPPRSAVISLFRAALRDISFEFTEAPKSEILEEITNVFVRLGSSLACRSIVDFGGTKFNEPSAAALNLSVLDADITHFLDTAFGGAIKLKPTTLVTLREPEYLLGELTRVMPAFPCRALINYMGFLVVVHLSAFLPERLVHLRQLFVKEMRGRTLPDVSNSTMLCALAVEHIMPACFNKLSAAVFRHAEYDARVPEKMSQLEDAFARNIGHLGWMSEGRIIINRYRIKRQRASQLGPSTYLNTNDSCASPDMSWRTDSPVEFYRVVSRAQRQATCQHIIAVQQGAALQRPAATAHARHSVPRRSPMPPPTAGTAKAALPLVPTATTKAAASFCSGQGIPAPKEVPSTSSPRGPNVSPPEVKETLGSADMKASSHQARSQAQNISSQMRACSAFEEAMDTTAPLVQKDRRSSLEHAK
ncbi:hypothetical protein HPB51_008152 [Rhipicephalus microplus]|uniref:Peptidase M13 N-terminal domain-containing protein n=1 Tax=Rhipicephalus microplus TaxID=6941 RepID=A0A9J6D4G9_RHIMP|nr:hypothetical protein HPB51_008152 [Rhipicephalus microplus]